MTRGADIERNEDRLISRVLRFGVFLAAGIVVIGGVLYLLRFGGQHPDYRVFQQEAGDLRHVSGIFHRAATGSARGIIQLGLLVLIATPVARVATSIFVFMRERDHLYALITLVVLAILAAGLFGGKPF